MSQFVAQLVAKLARGDASLAQVCEQIETSAHAHPENIPEHERGVHCAMTAGALNEHQADAIRDALQRATQTQHAPHRTSALSNNTVASADAAATLASARGLPAAAGSDRTLIRPSRAEVVSDSTVRKPPTANDTQRAHRQPVDPIPVDPLIEKTGISGHKPAALNDPTQRIVKAEPSEATRSQRANNITRTLRSPAADSSSADAESISTPESHSRTEAIADRLVKSLDQVEHTSQGPLQPGSVIKNRFVVQTVLGKGGMGLVFSAVDRRKEEARDPHPHVALKVLNADFQRHPQSFMALQREALKAQTLAHPNVVTVFDFDRDGDIVYMTMELLKGRTLESMVREARGTGIGRELALKIIRGIAEGLAYAHRKGIVHSDLKPANIFVTEEGTPKILDFGIARAVPSSIADDSEDEFDAGVLGAYTEAYATDEMVDGLDPHPGDDMYALGIIAYELLSGFHPYQRHSAPNARKLGVKPEPLKGLRRKEVHAIESCLSFDRNRRPQDAGEFLKLFRGVTTLQKATLAATLLLSLLAAYLSYQNYVETSPSIPFEQLSSMQQQEFISAMTQGREEWMFFEREHFDNALESAITHFAEAYRIHPRNREAVAALNEAADALLAAARTDEQKREFARILQTKSDHFRNYAPVVKAAK